MLFRLPDDLSSNPQPPHSIPATAVTPVAALLSGAFPAIPPAIQFELRHRSKPRGKIRIVNRQTQTRLKHFDSLLEWLDPDRDRAAERYEMIRQSLIQIFIWKRCSDAESLADETLDRVMSRIPELRKTYVGNPSAYIHSVAKNLLREQTRPSGVQVENVDSAIPATKDIENEKMYGCLERCLSNLSPYSRNLILDYYSEERAKTVTYRKDLAKELGIPINQLRIRVYRIRKTLEECIQACIGHEGSVE